MSCKNSSSELVCKKNSPTPICPTSCMFSELHFGCRQAWCHVTSSQGSRVRNAVFKDTDFPSYLLYELLYIKPVHSSHVEVGGGAYRLVSHVLWVQVSQRSSNLFWFTDWWNNSEFSQYRYLVCHCSVEYKSQEIWLWNKLTRIRFDVLTVVTLHYGFLDCDTG